MAKLKANEFVDLYEQTMKGCNKDCQRCELFLPSYNLCLHTADKRWQEWTQKEHKNFGEILKR